MATWCRGRSKKKLKVKETGRRHLRIEEFGETWLRRRKPTKGCSAKWWRWWSNEYGSLVGWYWRVKTDVLGRNRVPLRHYRARICHDVDWDQTRGFWMLYWGPCPKRWSNVTVPVRSQTYPRCLRSTYASINLSLPAWHFHCQFVAHCTHWVSCGRLRNWHLRLVNNLFLKFGETPVYWLSIGSTVQRAMYWMITCSVGRFTPVRNGSGILCWPIPRVFVYSI